MADSLNDTLPTYIHSLMFAPNVEALCAEEQRQYWLPRCESMEVRVSLLSCLRRVHPAPWPARA